MVYHLSPVTDGEPECYELFPDLKLEDYILLHMYALSIYLRAILNNLLNYATKKHTVKKEKTSYNQNITPYLPHIISLTIRTNYMQ